jgi:hypothetical protein
VVEDSMPSKIELSHSTTFFYKNTLKKELDVKMMFCITASIPKWWQWGCWISPVFHGETAITINEFLAPRWRKVVHNVLLFYFLFPLVFIIGTNIISFYHFARGLFQFYIIGA